MMLLDFVCFTGALVCLQVGVSTLQHSFIVGYFPFDNPDALLQALDTIRFLIGT